MCGLIGGTLYDAGSVLRGLELISHRGKDHRAVNFYPETELYLGHNRLAIQDLSDIADQPLRFGDDCSLVFNGELWRRSMDAHQTYTSDTRLLADLYSNCMGDAVAWAGDLDGMFAVAIYDRPRRRIVLARDWLGRMPLYYVLNHHSIAFASEAKALTGPLAQRFTGNATREQKKSQVKLFPPGSVATYSLDNGHFEVVAFRDFERYKEPVEFYDNADRGEEYYATGIRELLENAVFNESISDVPICTILSGGVDSTLVTAILARHFPDLRAYTVSVGESTGRDDLLFARYAAAAIGVELVEVVITKEETLAALRDTVWAIEDQRWHQIAPSVPQIAMARRIGADGYKVVFGGEGSDELFASYNDVRRFSWRPQQYHDERIDQCEKLHNNNIIRGNKAMMAGGTVELRTPFLDRELVDFCMRIPTRYRSDRDGAGKHMKYILRRAFDGVVPDPLLWRPKVAFQDGAHSSFLKDHKGTIEKYFKELFNGCA